MNRQNSVLFVFLFIKQTLGKILHGIQGSFKNLFPLPFQPFCRYPPQPIIIVVTNGFLHYTEIFIKALCTMPKNVFIGNGFLGMRSYFKNNKSPCVFFRKRKENKENRTETFTWPKENIYCGLLLRIFTCLLTMYNVFFLYW